MLALQYSRFGGPDVLGMGPVDEPHAGPGEIRVAVRAAGVTPADLVLRAGHLRPDLAFPHVPGVDAAGVVDEVGAGAEAAGAVGSTAVQLALARGARVIGTGSEKNHDALVALGAIPTTYGPGLPERVADLAAEGLDAALDTAGAGSLADLISITGDPAKVVTIADLAAAEHGVRMSYTTPGGPDGRYGLAVAAALAEKGLFRVLVREVFPSHAVPLHTPMSRVDTGWARSC